MSLGMRSVALAAAIVRQYTAVWERILDAYAASPDIEFAYPTQRILMDDGRE